LNALAAAIYLALVGPEGLKAVAVRSFELAAYARGRFREAGLALKYDRPFFREFVLAVKNPAEVNRELAKAGIIGGYAFPDGLMFAFTEKRTQPEIDLLVEVTRRAAR
jgi:glycine dehydrogenase subunit 1